jgi:hypothetical protein
MNDANAAVSNDLFARKHPADAPLADSQSSTAHHKGRTGSQLAPFGLLHPVIRVAPLIITTLLMGLSSR